MAVLRIYTSADLPSHEIWPKKRIETGTKFAFPATAIMTGMEFHNCQAVLPLSFIVLKLVVLILSLNNAYTRICDYCHKIIFSYAQRLILLISSKFLIHLQNPMHSPFFPVPLQLDKPPAPLH